MKRILFAAILIIMSSWQYSGAASESAQKLTIPFGPGEQLTYELRWLFIPAGQAKLEVLPITTFNGERAYHFLLTVRSNAFIDNFYKVRDKVEAWVDLNLAQSLHYRKNQQEGSTRRMVDVFFDWQRQLAKYETPHESRKPIPIPKGTLDPLSVLFYARCFDLSPAQKLRRPVTDGKKCVLGKGAVIRKQKIKLSNGRLYDTLLMEPQMEHIGGVFRKSPGAKIKIWLSDDDRRIPVKVESAVSVGHFTGELISDFPSLARRSGRLSSHH